jgi:hypothetical protein
VYLLLRVNHTHTVHPCADTVHAQCSRAVPSCEGEGEESRQNVIKTRGLHVEFTWNSGSTHVQIEVAVLLVQQVRVGQDEVVLASYGVW